MNCYVPSLYPILLAVRLRLVRLLDTSLVERSFWFHPNKLIKKKQRAHLNRTYLQIFKQKKGNLLNNSMHIAICILKCTYYHIFASWFSFSALASFCNNQSIKIHIQVNSVMDPVLGVPFLLRV